MAEKIKVIFVTSVFDQTQNGPATYASYLWEAFGEDDSIEFYVVAPSFDGHHERWCASGVVRGFGALYKHLSDAALSIARRIGGCPILHCNNAFMHCELIGAVSCVVKFCYCHYLLLLFNFIYKVS